MNNIKPYETSEWVSQMAGNLLRHFEKRGNIGALERMCDRYEHKPPLFDSLRAAIGSYPSRNVTLAQARLNWPTAGDLKRKIHELASHLFPELGMRPTELSEEEKVDPNQQLVDSQIEGIKKTKFYKMATEVLSDSQVEKIDTLIRRRAVITSKKLSEKVRHIISLDPNSQAKRRDKIFQNCAASYFLYLATLETNWNRDLEDHRKKKSIVSAVETSNFFEAAIKQWESEKRWPSFAKRFVPFSKRIGPPEIPLSVIQEKLMSLNEKDRFRNCAVLLGNSWRGAYLLCWLLQQDPNKSVQALGLRMEQDLWLAEQKTLSIESEFGRDVAGDFNDIRMPDLE